MSTRSIDRLARELVDLNRRLRGVESAPRLAYSSIDDGALKLYIDDLLAGYVGKLPDGSAGVVVVNRPPPPAPGAPTAEGVPGGIVVRWGGDWAQPAAEPEVPPAPLDPDNIEFDEETPDGPVAPAPAVAPLDFTRVEVHVSKTSGFTPSTFDTMVTTVESPRGGSAFIRTLDVDKRYVRLVARNTSGKASAPSAEIEVTPLPEMLEQTPTSYLGTNPPADPEENWLWWKQPGNTPHIYQDGAWVEITDAAAIEAAEAAARATASANSKNRIYYQDEAPAGTAHVLHDLWFDTNAGYKLHTWNGTEWVASELGHQAIGSIDLGKATVGLLSAKYIGTGALTAGQQLIAGGHSAQGALLANGGRIVLDDTGLKLITRANGVDTTTISMLTASGAGTFKGHVEASSGTFAGSLSGADGTFTGLLEGGTIRGTQFEAGVGSVRIEAGPLSYDEESSPALRWEAEEDQTAFADKPQISGPPTATSPTRLRLRSGRRVSAEGRAEIVLQSSAGNGSEMNVRTATGTTTGAQTMGNRFRVVSGANRGSSPSGSTVGVDVIVAGTATRFVVEGRANLTSATYMDGNVAIHAGNIYAPAHNHGSYNTGNPHWGGGSPAGAQATGGVLLPDSAVPEHYHSSPVHTHTITI